MKLTHAKDISNSGAEGPGLWTRLGRMLRGRRSSQRKPVMVKVWDNTRGQYRNVDLTNREDPLWFAAKSLAGMQDVLTRRTAA